MLRRWGPDLAHYVLANRMLAQVSLEKYIKSCR